MRKVCAKILRYLTLLSRQITKALVLVVLDLLVTIVRSCTEALGSDLFVICMGNVCAQHLALLVTTTVTNAHEDRLP